MTDEAKITGADLRRVALSERGALCKAELLRAADALKRLPEVERECAALRADVKRLREREQHFADALSVADGGQHRNDWDGAIRRVLGERDALRERADRAEAKHARHVDELRTMQALVTAAVERAERAEREREEAASALCVAVRQYAEACTLRDAERARADATEAKLRETTCGAAAPESACGECAVCLLVRAEREAEARADAAAEAAVREATQQREAAVREAKGWREKLLALVNAVAPFETLLSEKHEWRPDDHVVSPVFVRDVRALRAAILRAVLAREVQAEKPSRACERSGCNQPARCFHYCQQHHEEVCCAREVQPAATDSQEDEARAAEALRRDPLCKCGHPYSEHGGTWCVLCMCPRFTEGLAATEDEARAAAERAAGVRDA